MKKVGLLCIVLLGATVVWAQADRSAVPLQVERTVRDAAVQQALPAARATLDDQGDGHLFAFPEPLYYGDGDNQDAAGSKCPAASICGQNPLMTAGTWQYSDITFVNLPYGSGRVICESFPPPGEPNLTQSVAAITFHGAYANPKVTPTGECVKPHKFQIKFYPDSAGVPNVTNPVATYDNVVPVFARVIGSLNWTGGGTSDRYQFGVVLSPPFNPALVGGKGWVSIASSEQASGDCYFILGPAEEGNSACWRYWNSNPTGGAAQTNDIHYCFGLMVPGACCDDWSGICDENSNQFICSLAGRRFTPGTCATLDPLCGEMPGACCKADETCTPNMTRAACQAIAGAYWRGPQTVCTQCCWIPDCPSGAQQEAEPCGQSTNAGCRVTPPIFETITLQGSEPSFNATVCGTIWADGGHRDEDWFEFTANQQFELTIQNVNTQIPIRLTPHFSEAHGPPTCDDLWYYIDTLHDPCVVEAAFTPPVFPRGAYWIHVSPEDADGPVVNFYPCGTANEYSFEILVEYITCPNPCNIPGAIIVPENEPNYCTNPAPDTFNSGCDKTPPGPYLPITDNFEIWCGKSGWYNLGPEICAGDLNCSGAVDFGDINPFVLALSNWPQWKTTFPNCPEQNADVNKDGVYGGSLGFGDINPFVALLASGGGQPIPCPTGDALVADYDWYQFQIVGGPKTASFFMYAEFPVIWEVYQASAGCGAPALQHQEIVPCLSASKKTFCLPNGTYWLRVYPDTGVECGKEYALGLEEFLGCSFCSVTCPTPNTPENEACGDNTNGGCNSTPNAFEDVACNTTYCAWAYADAGTRDTDWFRLTLTASRYLIFTVHTEVPVLTGFMDTSVANCSYLYGYWVNVEACTAEPESWYFVDSSQQPVQFAAGTYWFTVFPDDGEDPIFYSYPCNRPAPFDLNTYWFSIECTTTPPQ